MPSSSLKRTAACALIVASSSASVSSGFQAPIGTSGAGLLRRPIQPSSASALLPPRVTAAATSARPTTASPLHMSSSALTQIRGPKGRPILSEDDVAAPPDAKVLQACEQAMRQQSGAPNGNGAVIASGHRFHRSGRLILRILVHRFAFAAFNRQKI